MKPPKDSLQESIARQRETLIGVLQEPLRRIAAACAEVWGDRARLDAVLAALRPELPHCKYIYALDTRAVQISDNISAKGVVEKDFGRDRSQRPYMREAVPAPASCCRRPTSACARGAPRSLQSRWCATPLPACSGSSVPTSTCATCR